MQIEMCLGLPELLYGDYCPDEYGWLASEQLIFAKLWTMCFIVVHVNFAYSS